MNEQLRPASFPDTTQAAEGLPRRRWTVAEIEAMVAKGIIGEDERFELIGGEAVPMSPKGARHELVKIALNRFFQRAAPDHLEIAPETTLRLDRDTFVEPDFCVFPRPLDLKALNGGAVLLAVEVADSSLAYDTGRKSGIYAAYGVREVWVINANTLATRVFRRVSPSGYGYTQDRAYGRRLEPELAPELALALADLGLSPIRRSRKGRR
jgi:Uma2 family endonuclease